MLQKIFDDNIAAICQSKAALMFNKPASFGMRILGLSKVLMYEFHYDYIKSKLMANQYYQSQTQIAIYVCE